MTVVRLAVPLVIYSEAGDKTEGRQAHRPLEPDVVLILIIIIV